MAKVNDLKLAKTRTDGKAQILVRIFISMKLRPQFRTGIFVAPKSFVNEYSVGKNPDGSDIIRKHNNAEAINVPKMSKLNFSEVKELKEVKKKLSLFLERLQVVCDVTSEMHKDELTAEWIENAIRLVDKTKTRTEDISYRILSLLVEQEKQVTDAAAAKAKERPFFELIEDYRLNAKKKVNGKRTGEKSDVLKKNTLVLVRALRRYELFVRMTDRTRKDFKLDAYTMTTETIDDIESYLRNEHSLYEQYPRIFARINKESQEPRQRKTQKPRGNNAICSLFNKFKSFFHWLNEQHITTNNPFVGYEGVVAEHYGTPYYISKEERNIIANFDLADKPHLAVQRDIFVFHCWIGCRVSDLERMTPNNLVVKDGVWGIEYVPSKTKGEKRDENIVRVTLGNVPLSLVRKYEGIDTKGRLFPFISAQKYNVAIKEIFTECGITRLVTVLDSVTGEATQRPINEVASSHMARRCFVGNLYKACGDLNLVASMSGHAAGSKAISRYYNIDDEMKKNALAGMD